MNYSKISLLQLFYISTFRLNEQFQMIKFVTNGFYEFCRPGIWEMRLFFLLLDLFIKYMNNKGAQLKYFEKEK